MPPKQLWSCELSAWPAFCQLHSCLVVEPRRRRGRQGGSVRPAAQPEGPMADRPAPRAASEIAKANEAVRLRLPFADADDFDDARRGRLGSLSDGVIRATSGRVVWDADAYGFLDRECPETVNPSLWRQGQLNAIHGLFEVAEGIYQVRGLDLSNMTIVEGKSGVLVIDPLISCETAAAALALYREHRGERPRDGPALHPQPRRPLRRRARRCRARRMLPRGACRCSHRRDSSSTRQRERLRGHGDDAPRHLHVRRARCRRAPTGRSARASGRRPRSAPSA